MIALFFNNHCEVNNADFLDAPFSLNNCTTDKIMTKISEMCAKIKDPKSFWLSNKSILIKSKTIIITKTIEIAK